MPAAEILRGRCRRRTWRPSAGCTTPSTRGTLKRRSASLIRKCSSTPSPARFDFPVGKGRAHISALTASWIASFDEWREEIEEIRDVDGRILVVSIQRGRGKGSGIDVESRYALIYELHGGKITGLRMYRSPEAALEAAGLSE